MTGRVPLLFLPGLMCDARLFAPQLADLADAADMRVADLGRPGPPTVEALAADALAQAPWPRFAACGLSMGGIVAMAMLRAAPGRIAALALLDTNHRAEMPDRQAARGPQIERALAGGLRRVLVEEMKPLYLAPGHAHREEILETVLDMAVDLGPDVFRRQSLALRDRPDSADTLRGVRVPTLVLCGRHDRLCPPSRHEEMAALAPGARLAFAEAAGHLSTLEAPDEVGRELRAWLAEAAAALSPAADRP